MCPSKCASTCASLTEAGQGQTGGDCPGTPHGGTPGVSRGSPTGGSKKYVPPTHPGRPGAAAYRKKVQHHWVPASHGHGHGQDSVGRHRKTKLEGEAEAKELT